MKKYVLLILLTLNMGIAQALPVFIEGTILDSTGNGIPNQRVEIFVFSTFIWTPFDVDTTDANGIFRSSGNSADSVAQFQFITIDCIGDSIIWFGNYDAMVSDSVITTISICSNTLPNCTASFSANLQGNNIVQFAASSNPQPSSSAIYTWDFGDGSAATSTSTVITHQYLDTGTYTVCLTFNDSINGCIVNTCDTVFVGPSNPVNCSLSFTTQNYGAAYAFFGIDSNSSPVSMYSWDFGDGNSSAGLNAVNLYANPGLYNVCLQVIDSLNPCIYCDSLLVSFDTSQLRIGGNLNVNSTGSTGDLVILYEATNTGSAPFIQAIDSTIVVNGNYVFYGLNSSTYSLKVIPRNPAMDPGLMPQYWISSSYWGNANSLVLNSNQSNIDLSFNSNSVSLNGQGYIEVSLRDAQNQAISDAVVWIEDMNHQVLRYEISNSNSNIQFSNLPFGNYRVGTDYPGYYMFKEDVTLSSSSPSDSIGLRIIGNWLTTPLNKEYLAQQIDIYPNPASDFVLIKHDFDEVSFKISDLQGREIRIEVHEMDEGARISFSELPKQGIYLIQLITDQFTLSKKLMVD